jgi:hypothetical protein
MVELSAERRPSVHQDEADKPIVSLHYERNPAVFSPITVESIVYESTVGAGFTVGRSDLRKFREIILIELHQIRDGCTLAHGDLCQSHAIVTVSSIEDTSPRRSGYAATTVLTNQAGVSLVPSNLNRRSGAELNNYERGCF